MKEIVIAYGLYYIFFTAGLLFLFRKYMYSIFDPLIFVILIISSSLSLSVGSNLFIYILLASIAFYLAFLSIGKPNFKQVSVKPSYDIKLLKLFTLLFLLLFLISGFILLSSSGIPLLSKDPSITKVTIFTAGTGWIRRIIFISDFLPVALLMLIIYSKNKLRFALYLILYLSISILAGSKGSVLNIFLILYYYYWFSKNSENIKSKKIEKIIRGSLAIIILLSFCVFFIIVAKESSLTHDKNSGFIYDVGYRFMEFGDATLLYKANRVQHFFSQYSTLDFFKYEFSDILGMLRLGNFKPPLGYEMVNAFIGTQKLKNVFGPNCIFLIKGNIFFGFYGGIIYCYIIGLLFAFIRRSIFENPSKSFFLFCIQVYILFSLNTLLRESSQLLSTYFAFALYLSPIFILSILLTSKRDYLILKQKSNKSNNFTINNI